MLIVPSPSSIGQDDSLLSRIDQKLHKLEKLSAIAGGIVIFLVILLTTINVLGRWIFNLPISGYIDWTEQAMAFLAFLAIAYTQRLGGHIRMDIILRKINKRMLWLIEAITTSVMFLLTCILIYGTWLHFLRAWQLGDSSLDIDLPIWPAKLIVPIMLSAVAVRLFLQIWGYSRAFINRQDYPVAVPLIEDIVPQDSMDK